MSHSCIETKSPLTTRLAIQSAVGACNASAESLLDKHICRLSFYLKCCVIGCGIQGRTVDSELLECSKAHLLPIKLQQVILELALTEFSTEKLVNRIYFLDDRHRLLPTAVSNMFLPLEMNVATFFPIQKHIIIRGRQLPIRNTMLCTTQWLNEMYITPIRALQQFLPPETIPSNAGLIEDSAPSLLSCCRGKGCVLNKIQGLGYKCPVCPDFELCERCYHSYVEDHHPLHGTFKTIQQERPKEANVDALQTAQEAASNRDSVSTETDTKCERRKFPTSSPHPKQGIERSGLRRKQTSSTMRNSASSSRSSQSKTRLKFAAGKRVRVLGSRFSENRDIHAVVVSSLGDRALLRILHSRGSYLFVKTDNLSLL